MKERKKGDRAGRRGGRGDSVNAARVDRTAAKPGGPSDAEAAGGISPERAVTVLLGIRDMLLSHPRLFPREHVDPLVRMVAEELGVEKDLGVAEEIGQPPPGPFTIHSAADRMAQEFAKMALDRLFPVPPAGKGARAANSARVRAVERAGKVAEVGSAAPVLVQPFLGLLPADAKEAGGAREDTAISREEQK